ncbi:MAG TPA: hypothetical protein VFT84_15985 [Gemmatimonadales bacterium]|nr:hypothetical protein [Gemmatimonadales bacterium]
MTAAAEPVIRIVLESFRRVPYPGDPFLQGSFDGEEPYDEIRHFKGKSDWSALEPAFLDARYCALSFFSEAAFRFFVPAYIVADLRDALLTADPAFHLTHGFAARSYRTETVGQETITWESGGPVPLNPRRYGAMRWMDHARYRLSVFAREEAAAIVAYLRWRQKREGWVDQEEVRAIDAAIAGFWEERVRTAPTQAELEAHVERELANHAAWLRHRQSRPEA